MDPALALPDPIQPYHLYTDKRLGVATLFQPVGPSNQGVTVLSKQLDPTICGCQLCLRGLAAVAELTREAHKISLFPSMVYSTYHLSDLWSHSFSILGPKSKSFIYYF